MKIFISYLEAELYETKLTIDVLDPHLTLFNRSGCYNPHEKSTLGVAPD